jgi:undecaprenyl diphosphate synthase
MEHLIAATGHCSGTTLSLALSYGSRQDLVRAARELAAAAKAGVLDPATIDETVLQSKMSTTDLPNVDLLIRTGGESRISDFLLYEAAYAELCFLDMMWPEFRGDDFRRIVGEYQGVERRFGLTSEQVDEGELSLVSG